ncbi:hypothetical protein FGK63_05285 [Ruegeria sediminis]|uniref:Uncharacterized protein n=1 Tax=Ruegeria sediminis TaxID=2583820 RepID=A0ABY2WZZ8_9RHOB|nr:hypothetical protein [Ruegeria sediminis]TMV08542.1 hypothetical protein FGK63_05285 [Ruegeria sediminis]
MNLLQSSVPIFALLVLVSGCAPTPESLETEPVQVQTSKGVVTCQLYTHSRVLWDRAIDRPNNMSVKEGDEVCRNEGRRRLGG